MESKELQVFSEKRLSLETEVARIKVEDPVSYQFASELSKVIKDLKKAITDYFRPMKEQAYKAWQAVCQKEKDEISKIEPLDEKLKREMTNYVMEENRKKAEEERKRQEEIIKQEVERRAKMAEILKESGQEELAKAIADVPVEVPEVDVIEEVPKVEGISYREDYDFEIVNEALIPRQFLMPNEKAIRAFIKATKGRTEIAGVRILKKMILVRK